MRPRRYPCRSAQDWLLEAIALAALIATFAMVFGHWQRLPGFARRGNAGSLGVMVFLNAGVYLLLTLAARYHARADQPEHARAIFDEWERTERMLLAVTGEEGLLGARAGLRSAVDLRAPYVDALSYLQLRFLDDPKATRLVQATIAGVAAGLQNTG